LKIIGRTYYDESKSFFEMDKHHMATGIRTKQGSDEVLIAHASHDDNKYILIAYQGEVIRIQLEEQTRLEKQQELFRIFLDKWADEI
jgi:hypothetical protein